MEDQFDAILSVGSKSSISISDVSIEKCSDPEYVAMRTGRLQFMGLPGIVNTLLERCRTKMQNR